MTPLKKAVRRRTEELVRDRSKFRRLIITIYPAGYIGLRMEKCRKEETLSYAAAYRMAIQSRIDREREVKRKAKGGAYMVKRGRL